MIILNSIDDFFINFPDEDSAYLYLFPNGINCPKCGYDKQYLINDKSNKFKCARPGVNDGCKKKFNYLTNTVFWGAKKIGIQKILYSIFIYSLTRKINTMELRANLGITQKSAWLVAYKIIESTRDKNIDFTDTSVAFEYIVTILFRNGRVPIKLPKRIK